MVHGYYMLHVITVDVLFSAFARISRIKVENRHICLLWPILIANVNGKFLTWLKQPKCCKVHENLVQKI